MTNLVGQTIHQYQIIEHLGGGGMAYVYKAYHPGLDVYRAIKIIRPEFVNQPGFQERFRREAQAVARLRHPNIVQIHDYGAQDELYYMVMEFIEGQDLKDHLRRSGAMRPFSRVVEIMEQVASALDYAHRQGVLHRDIKPANIMLTPNQEVILTDFGIAKILQQDKPTEQQTEAGVIIGTPAYMAPEQARGLPDIGPTADIYSLGIVLYELLTGQVPYQADTPLAVILKVINDPLPPPRTFSPDIPDVLQGVVLKATAKEPAQRYQTAEAFADGLKRSLSAGPEAPPALATPTVQRPAPPAAQPAPTAKKSGWLAGGALGLIALFCVVAALAGAGIYYWTRPAPSLATWQFIVDASAGMNDTIDGQAKIDIARAALDKELRILPDNVNAGLRVFGGQQSGLDPCQDTRLLVEPVAGRSKRIPGALAEITPQGEAPLTEAIVQAIGDFDLSRDTKNSLIIITGGLDTCEAEAVSQLETLSRRLGIEVDLHLIGLGVQDPAETEQLQELARAAAGDYYAANNEEEIGRVLRDQISILQGTPAARVTPSPTNTPAPAITPTNTSAPAATPTPQTLALTEPVNLSNNPGNSRDAALAFDAGGNLHLVWLDNTPRTSAGGYGDDLLYRMRAPNGDWSEAVVLTQGQDVLRTPPELLAQPDGRVCLFWDGGAGRFFQSCYTGSGWSATEQVAGSFAIGVHTYAPAFAPDDTLQTVWNTGSTLYLGEAELASGSLNDGLIDQPTFTVDRAGNYHVAWVRQSNPFRLEYIFSGDGGQSWSEVEQLTETGAQIAAANPRLVADTQGNVHLAWRGNFYRRWTPGQGWEASVEIRPGSAWFDLVADAEGLAHMVWVSISGELYYARQQSDGAWSQPQLLVENAQGGQRPTMAVDAQGTRHFVWISSEDVYYATLNR